jgi:hypothetical protein
VEYGRPAIQKLFFLLWPFPGHAWIRQIKILNTLTPRLRCPAKAHCWFALGFRIKILVIVPYGYSLAVYLNEKEYIFIGICYAAGFQISRAN